MIFDDDTLEMLGYGQRIDLNDKNLSFEMTAVRPDAPEGGWKRRAKTIRANCIYCLQQMPAARVSKKWCSSECRHKSLGSYVAPLDVAGCGHCGAPMRIRHASRKRFCSGKCRLRAHRAALAARGLNVLGKPKVQQPPGRTPEERRAAFKARYHSDPEFRRRCIEHSARWNRKQRKAA